jgi:hypothetical protein
LAWFVVACLLRWRAFFADLGLTPLELAFEDLVTDDGYEDAIRAVSELAYGGSRGIIAPKYDEGWERSGACAVRLCWKRGVAGGGFGGAE